MTATDLDMFYGGAGGSAQKALRILEVDAVLISYVTKNNRPWDSIQRLFLDSGGYSVLSEHDDYQTTDREYVQYLQDHRDPLEFYALRDYPTDDDTLEKHDATVRDHQRQTTRRHADLLDVVDGVDLDAQPVAVAQGHSPDDYVRHLDELQDAGALTDHVGIGSLVDRDPSVVPPIIQAVRDALPSRHTIHGFGVSRHHLVHDSVVQNLDTADTCSYERRARDDSAEHESCDFRHVAAHWYKFDRRVREILRDADERASGPIQSTFGGVAGGD